MVMDSKNDTSSVEQLEFGNLQSAPIPVHPQPDPAAERRLLRKLDCVILPWIMLMYFLSYMDRYVVEVTPSAP